MKCPACDTRLKIAQTYAAGRKHQTQTGQCAACGRSYTLVTMIAQEFRSYGEGAYALARKLDRGELLGGLVLPEIDSAQEGPPQV